MYTDKTLVCKECGKEFVFTAGEQEFYAEKGFQNEPQRCRECRNARKNNARPEREMFDAVCANCGKTCKVPFRPREDRPVYCSECFAEMKEGNSTLLNLNGIEIKAHPHPGWDISLWVGISRKVWYNRQESCEPAFGHSKQEEPP